MNSGADSRTQKEDKNYAEVAEGRRKILEFLLRLLRNLRDFCVRLSDPAFSITHIRQTP